MGAEGLTGFRSVDRWLDNFEREVSRRNCLYTLGVFVEYAGKNPDVLVEEARADPEAMEASVKKFHRHLKKERFAAKSRRTIYGGVRSFFGWNGVKFGRMPRGFGKGVTYEGRRLLSRVEVARMVDVSPSLRDKAVIAVAAWSAQREEVLRALRWGMVRKQVEKGKGLVVVRVPSVFLDERGENANKAEAEYMFAFGEEAVEYVRGMMEQRKGWGEPVDDDAWLFRSYRVLREGHRNPLPLPRNSRSVPLGPNKLNMIVERAARRAGIQKSRRRERDGKRQHEIHLHAFRRYWKHTMRSAGIRDDEFLNYVLGHVPPYGGAYDKYTEALMTQLYRQASPHLSLTRGEGDVARVKEEAALEAMRRMAEAMGVDPMRIKIEREKSAGRALTMEEELKLIQGEISKLVSPQKSGRAEANGGRPYEAAEISEKELVEYMEAGWEIVRELRSGRIVVRRNLS